MQSILTNKTNDMQISFHRRGSFRVAYNGLQLTDSFCFSQKFWLGAVITSADN